MHVGLVRKAIYSRAHAEAYCQGYKSTLLIMLRLTNLNLDMSQPPFNMTFSHFGSGLSIAEVGGPGNLFPEIRKDKEFDLKV